MKASYLLNQSDIYSNNTSNEAKIEALISVPPNKTD
jgi:hypothetical protein